MREELPPFSLDSEEATLGSILIDEDAMSVVNVQPADFFSEQNQLVFAAMQKVEHGINQLTVAQALVEMGMDGTCTSQV